MRYDASHYAVHYLFAIASSFIPAPDLLSTYESVSLLRRDATVVGGKELRILPLGDSITYGQGSSDGNGYRLALYDLLHPENDVDYIGRLRSGTMVDNDHEGHQGFLIGPITKLVTSKYHKPPNLVLLMAGTNDVIQKHNLSTSSAALEKLMNKVLNAYPDAVVLVAEITPFLNPEREARRLEYNSAIPGVIQKFADDGRHVAVVDMGRVTPNDISAIDRNKAIDGIHPNDEGYRLIAHAWYDAILAAGKKGWLDGLTPSPLSNHNTVGGQISYSPRTPLVIATYGVMLLVVLSTVRKLIRKHRT